MKNICDFNFQPQFLLYEKCLHLFLCRSGTPTYTEILFNVFSISLFCFRMYPIKEVPMEAEALTDWLYQRFVEKEELLAHFYNTGKFVQLKFIIIQMQSQLTGHCWSSFTKNYTAKTQNLLYFWSDFQCKYLSNLQVKILLKKLKVRTNIKNNCTSIRGIQMWNNCCEELKTVFSLFKLKKYQNHLLIKCYKV